MSTPYGGNDPQQWGQQPQGAGTPADPSSGGFPAQDQQWQQQQQPGQEQWQQQWQQQPGMGGYPPPSGPQPQQPGYEQQWQQQPGGGYPFSGPQPQQPPQPGQGQWQQPGGGGYPGQPPYGYPGGYQQYGQPAMQQPPKKSKTPLWIGLGVLVLILGAAAVLLFWTPGVLAPRVFDSSAVEKGVEKIRPEVEKGATSCPDDQQVEKDHTFSCTVTVNGQEKKVQIKVVDEEKAQYEVGNPG